MRRPKGANLSRRQIMEAKRLVWSKKQKALEETKMAMKKAKIEEIQHRRNKKAKRPFDRLTLRAVQDGLTAAIEGLGEALTPLSLFMAALTALSRSAERHQVPYLLSILASCLPHLSQGFLRHQAGALFGLCGQILAEYAAGDHLIAAKAIKLAQAFLLNLEAPDGEVLARFTALEPSRLHIDAMRLYLASFRKLLERAALDGAPPRRDPHTGLYPLSANPLFFLKALPRFVDLVLANVGEAPEAVAAATIAELALLLRRGLSPYVVESAEGARVLDGLLSHQLLALFRPVYQRYWGLSAELLEGLFDRMNYLKRTPAARPFTERFPSVVFLIRVLNKLRGMDDVQLNGKIERALVAIGKGMTVREFVRILPFDPRAAVEAERRGDDPRAAALWSTSYTLNVIRRIAAHDALPDLVEIVFPSIQFCSQSAQEAERAQRPADRARWTALLVQYWRVVAGFCHYPRVLTNDSFREVFKQLVALLSSPTFVDTSATAIHVLCGGYYQLSRQDEDDDDDEARKEDGGGEKATGGHGSPAASPPVDFDDDDDDDEEEEDRLEDDLRGEGERRSFRVGARRRARHPRSIHASRRALDEDDVFLSMNDPGWAPHRYHGISQARAREVCETIFAKYSANIMPKLCNTFETHSSTAVLRAIESFSKVCSPSVMTSILNGILDVSHQIAAAVREKGEGEKAEGPPVSQTARRRMVLDIACAVVAQLPLAHLTRLVDDVIEPVLMDPAPESRLLQKKAYKLLFAMFEHRVRELAPMFPRVLGMLAVGRAHVTISGVKMRLRCLSWALDACKMFHPAALPATIHGILAEVVLFSREPAHETRALAMTMVERMQRYGVGAGAPVNALLHRVLAGLTGRTPAMRCGAVVCLAKLVYLTHGELPTADLDGAVAVGLRLIDAAEPEVRHAAGVFARMVLKLMKRSPRVGAAVAKALPRLLYAIAVVTSQRRVSSGVRLEMRGLLETLLKRFGDAQVEPMFPLGSKNFLRYTQRMRRREEKKADRAQRRHEARRQNEFDRFFMGAGMRVGGGVDAADEDLLGAGALHRFVSQHTTPSLPGLPARASHADAAAERNPTDDDDDDDAMHLEFTDGKLRILTRAEKQHEEALRRRQAMADRLLRRPPGGGGADADDLNTDARRRPGKRGRFADDVVDFENDELILRYGGAVGGKGGEKEVGRRMVGPSSASPRPPLGRAGLTPSLPKQREQKAVKQELKRRRVEEDIRKGDEFVGRGAGDIKSGNIEPFAYVPLNRTYMNRRNTRQALHRFEVIQGRSLKGEKAKAVYKAPKSK